MSKYFTSVIACVCIFISQSQAQDYTTTELYLNVKTDQEEPVPNTAIWLVETVSGEELPSITNNKGSVNFTVDKGKTYSVNFKDKKEHTLITISPKQTSLLAKTIHYNPPVVENTNLVVTADTVYQHLQKGIQPKRTEILVRVKVLAMEQQPLKNLTVSLLNGPTNTCYVATTDDAGTASFLVYPDKEYTIGLVTFPHYQTFQTPAIGGLTVERTIKFEPSAILEQDTLKDTIRQTLPANIHATSTEAYVNVLVNDYNGQPLANEDVMLNVIGDTNVYFAKTGTSGYAKFLLPKGKKYSISFRYDRDVDVLDYATDPKGNIRTEVEFTYIGTEKIEEFYKNAKRDDAGFLLDFITVEAGVTQLDKNMYYKKTDLGFNLSLGSTAYMMPPTLYGDQLFTSGGVHNNVFLSFNRLTGDFVWGARLKEGGVSASVCVNDVVFVITESCTLYAFDAKTGKLLWGKWLSEWMFSSPTANDKYVYAVYKDELAERSKFVFICLEIKTGNIVWQNEVDSDILTTPVLADDKVYITTKNGNLIQFNATTGQQTGILKNMAATLPTITADKIFIGELTDPHTIALKCYSKDLQPVSLVNPVTLTFEGNAIPSTYLELMYHCGFRVTHYGNLNYNMVKNELVCSDPAKQTIVWKKKIFPDVAKPQVFPRTYQPVIAGNKLLIATPEGLIQLLNPKTGTLIKEYVLGKTLLSQPVAYNGWIFIGTDDGYLMGIDTKDNSITGWPGWGGNANHNTVVE